MQLRKRNITDVLDAVQPGANILIRVDFNVPMDGSGKITDDSRIRGALPSIQAVLRKNCNAILVSHMGRPKLVQKGGTDAETQEQRQKLSLKPVATHLSQLIGKPVGFGTDCVGDAARQAVSALPQQGGGGVVLLENLRFHKEEEKNEANFAKALASLADAYVNDAFGTSHRAHASTFGVPKAMANPKLCGIGSLVASELEYLDFSSLAPGETVAAIIGGSKVSTKLPVIQGLLKQVDTLILGGGLAFTFLKAQGVSIGNSLVEEGMLETALGLIQQAKASGKNLLIPVDAVCSQSFPSGPMKKSDTKTFDLTPGAGIPNGWMGLDVGPKTVAKFQGFLKNASKVVFNGPMGVFEVVPFDEGTRGLVNVLSDITKQGTITVVGGGDSVAALEAFGKTKEVSYVSTGGGATLELLAGDKLPGVEAIGNV